MKYGNFCPVKFKIINTYAAAQNRAQHIDPFPAFLLRHRCRALYAICRLSGSVSRKNIRRIFRSSSPRHPHGCHPRGPALSLPEKVRSPPFACRRHAYRPSIRRSFGCHTKRYSRSRFSRARSYKTKAVYPISAVSAASHSPAETSASGA